ncbi:universal protein YeaZ [Gemmatirosa kalamazoonensis]|uniref:Universal protein YeaZ n=1 Tax=Gemmatirosa kalamazoonensis TaxID=861299 RepID=W0RJY7_9BACT|nr:tRNA (adenosine(37)-N6)-threonylcarbamoyltransferase complex dimerization subunit type 1 TsaB [Gemmatirosa kalamazoonensis]AHG91096.1 universal protein YeaZ [Gemmatirosa kalamazoonensis]
MTTPFTSGTTWLAIDASTYAGTVAVLRGRDVVAAREVAMRGEREERLMPTVVDALHAAGASPRDLTGLVCGAGPGSFTSLRIAASIAKGLAQVAERPLFAAPSLALMTGGRRTAGRHLASLDALRGEAYAAVVALDDAGDVVGYEYLGVVHADALDDLARAHHATPLRAGESTAPRAAAVAALGRLLAERGPVDLDAWEPDYGRKAEAQVKWEAAHGRELPSVAVALDGGAGS